ncbi:histidine--tRNA ligase [Candidatus Woesearchaeota archaeon]|nr:MAG: histidine--tRNA ligase [Candidatus Woesearchaeota archaeon]
MAFQKPRGTEDFFPEDRALQNLIFEKIRKVCSRYNYKEVESPAFETFELLAKKSGEEIKEQIFVLEKRGKEEFGLRFDLTVPIVRMFIEKQKSLPKPVRWYGLSRMWRYEKPQAGRLREFYQLSIELFGSDKPEADAEMIDVAIEILKELGLTPEDVVIKVNDRYLMHGLLENLGIQNVIDVFTAIDKIGKIEENEFIELLKDMKLDDKQIKELLRIIKIRELDEIAKYKNSVLGTDGLNRLRKIFDILKNKKEFLEFNPGVVRGLAYYTGTVFECFDKQGKLRSILGGGRYNDLVKLLGGQSEPAIGFGLGYSTLFMLLKQKNLLPKIELAPDYYIAPVDKKITDKAVEIAEKLRKKGLRVETDVMQRKLAKQMQYANAIKAKKVIVLGEDELKKGEVKIKDMKTGKEENVKITLL